MRDPSFSLNGQQLKLIAIVAMFLDHFAWAFVKTNSGWGQALHAVGRITAPLMCFFIAEGYRHTGSLPRYFKRMAFFALLSQAPFTLFSVGKVALFPLNMIYTLTLGLAVIHSYESIAPLGRRNLTILGLLFLALPGDWTFLAPLLCLLFHVYRDDLCRQRMGIGLLALFLMGASLLISGFDFPSLLRYDLFHLGVLFSLPLLSLYNGERGGTKSSRWFFYVFYPLHLLILGVWRW